MCQAMSLRARAGDACGCGSRVMEEGRSVRLNPAATWSFLGWAPSSPGKQRGTVVVPSVCRCSLARVQAPSPAMGTEGASHPGCPLQEPGDVVLSCWALGTGEWGWGRCSSVPSNAQSTPSTTGTRQDASLAI